MTDPAASHTVLDRIYALGERMRTVLAEQDVEAFVALIEQRGELVALLEGAERPARAPEAWKERAGLLDQQYAAIMAMATEQEHRLLDAGGVLKQVRQAKARYSDPRVPPRFLNKNLSG